MKPPSFECDSGAEWREVPQRKDLGTNYCLRDGGNTFPASESVRLCSRQVVLRFVCEDARLYSANSGVSTVQSIFLENLSKFPEILLARGVQFCGWQLREQPIPYRNGTRDKGAAGGSRDESSFVFRSPEPW